MKASATILLILVIFSFLTMWGISKHHHSYPNGYKDGYEAGYLDAAAPGMKLYR
jgi:hypothetical protein